MCLWAACAAAVVSGKTSDKGKSYVTGHCTTTKNKCRNTTKGSTFGPQRLLQREFDVNGIMEGNGLIRWNQTKDVYEGPSRLVSLMVLDCTGGAKARKGTLAIQEWAQEWSGCLQECGKRQRGVRW